MYDVIIIGKGPAGLSAAIYLCRAGRKVLIIGKENQIWKKDVKINNYFGVGETTGLDLMVKGEAQARRFGAETVDDFVIKVEVKDGFIVHAKKQYKARNLLIATGASKKEAEISNEKDYIGRGVSYCVPCDGFFFKDKKVFVIGNGDYALQEAIELLEYTNNVTIVTNGKKHSIIKAYLKSKGIGFETFKINKILGSNKVEGVLTDKGEEKVSGLFIATGNASASDLARMLGIIMQGDTIKVDENMRTNIPNVWAVGDCTKGLAQICTAVAEGAVAGTNIIKGDKW